jgi:hypothetical protein
MKSREELQEVDGYQLKTNSELIDIIRQTKELIELFEAVKTFHELPNNTTAEYNEGYVNAMSISINRLKEIF